MLWISQEIDDLLDRGPVLGLLPPRAADPVDHAAHEARLHQVMAADRDVVEHGHAVEQGEVLECAADPEAGTLVGARAA